MHGKNRRYRQFGSNTIRLTFSAGKGAWDAMTFTLIRKPDFV